MERITLEPVDGVDVTTVVDNSSDMLMPDEGLVRRWGMVGTAGEIPVIPTELAEGGKTADFLRAEHGFSALIEVQAGGGRRRVLFDAGITPDGLIGNLDRLAISPDTFEAVVLSHGHFDHVMGLDGLARLARAAEPAAAAAPGLLDAPPDRHPGRGRVGVEPEQRKAMKKALALLRMGSLAWSSCAKRTIMIYQQVLRARAVQRDLPRPHGSRS